MAQQQFRHFSARFRVNVCAGVGVLAGVAVAPFAPWQLAVLTGWGVLSSVMLAWIWYEIMPCDDQLTAKRSTVEDNSHATAVVVMVTASVMSLVGVGLGLAKARHEPGGMAVLLTLVSVLTVLLSWLVVHTMFLLRYAHLYYIEPIGGIDFPGDEPPDYRDFAYFAFTVGMAFAVSDAVVVNPRIRRVVLHHALVSYLFGVVIVGLTINVTAGFIR